jgi:type I restriction enzyme S subunit
MRGQSQFIEMYRRAHKEMTLESVCTIVGKGITPKYVDSSSVVVINQACVHWDGQHLENIKYHNKNVPVKKRTLETGDVLLNATGNGTLGRCCVFSCPSDENQYVNDGHVIAISTNRLVILPEVLNSYLSLSDTQAEIYRQYVTGSTNQIDIVFTDIKKMTVPVPNMREQLQFVSTLQQADKSKFVGFKSQFIEMFGGCANRIKLSSLCSTFVDGDWIESKDQSELGVRLIQTGNVGNGFFKDKEDKSRYISEETFDNLHCTEIYPGDILVSRLPDPIGRACIIPQGIGRTITAVDCTIIRLKDIILPDYFITYTMTPSYAAQINEVTTGTTRRRVSRANLGNILIPCPSTAKQQQFVAIAKQADKSKFELRKSIDAIDQVIKSLING